MGIKLPDYMNDYPLASIIITTRNEEANIQNCLKSIKNQTYPQGKIETIVVNNNSVDKTTEMAKRYSDRIYNKGPERSTQRNFGVKQAVGEYILYLDADMILSKNVISECVKKCEEGNFIALYIPERIVNMPPDHLNNLCNLNFNLRNQRFWIKVRDFERSFYNATCIDCVRFVRRDKFLEIDGFDENLTGPEDWDFDRRIRNIGKVDIIDTPTIPQRGRIQSQKISEEKRLLF